MKRAFTLSEVLITIVVIGIIAAITIPIVVTKMQQQQTVTQLKKVYSELNQAVMQSEVTNGFHNEWDYGLSTKDFFDKYLKPYVKLSESSINEAKKQNIIYYETSGKPETGLRVIFANAVIVNLLSGAQLILEQTYVDKNSKGMGIIVDINGERKPNRFGRDVFDFHLLKDGQIIPAQKDDNEDLSVRRTRNQLLNGPSRFRYQCNKQGRGMWCAALIMNDGWKIKSDYPW